MTPLFRLVCRAGQVTQVIGVVAVVAAGSVVAAVLLSRSPDALDRGALALDAIVTATLVAVVSLVLRDRMGELTQTLVRPVRLMHAGLLVLLTVAVVTAYGAALTLLVGRGPGVAVRDSLGYLGLALLVGAVMPEVAWIAPLLAGFGGAILGHQVEGGPLWAWVTAPPESQATAFVALGLLVVGGLAWAAAGHWRGPARWPSWRR
ncbi:MAG: hypothetical protein ACOYY2_09045 [Actinomycetota bacterium]